MFVVFVLANSLFSTSLEQNSKHSQRDEALSYVVIVLKFQLCLPNAFMLLVFTDPLTSAQDKGDHSSDYVLSDQRAARFQDKRE